ncbi:MAG: kynureninase [Planctomycetaceae bacterium]
MNEPSFNLQQAQLLDAADELRHLRARFEMPSDVIYLDGNSLGAMPKRAVGVLADTASRQWASDLIRSWNDNDWIGAPQRVGGKIAPLIGSGTHEVIVADSVSVNIFKLLTAICRDRSDCTTILTEAGSFPTDAHVAQGAADVFELNVELVERCDLLGQLNEKTAVLLLSHVHYKSGDRFDMASINAAAKRRGVPVVWDLSHSTGAVPLDLRRDGTDYAVGCGYKYLNGGPGAPAFVYVSGDRQQTMRSPLQGWMGHAAPFAFEDDYEPAPGMDRFLVGTPPILSLLALECGIDEFADIDLEQVWSKSQSMFDLLASQMAKLCPQLTLITPVDASHRGSHASFSHPNAWPINNALIARGVIGDFRTPDVLRFGLTPLYTRFEDITRAVNILAEILETEEWCKPEYSQAARVT